MRSVKLGQSLVFGIKKPASPPTVRQLFTSAEVFMGERPVS